MRFRLRTLLIVFLLLALSAPWWPETVRIIRSLNDKPYVVPANQVDEAELDALVKQVRKGMTIKEINSVFGFESGSIYALDPGDTKACWVFQNPRYSLIQVKYIGDFENGRLEVGGLFYGNTLRAWTD